MQTTYSLLTFFTIPDSTIHTAANALKMLEHEDKLLEFSLWFVTKQLSKTWWIAFETMGDRPSWNCISGRRPSVAHLSPRSLHHQCKGRVTHC